MKLTPAQAIKLASIVVHVEEYFGPRGHPYDKTAIESLLKDPDVRKVLDTKANAVFLPRKRS